MYTALALCVLMALIAGLALLPFRFAGLSARIVEALRKKVLLGRGAVLFPASAPVPSGISVESVGSSGGSATSAVDGAPLGGASPGTASSSHSAPSHPASSHSAHMAAKTAARPKARSRPKPPEGLFWLRVWAAMAIPSVLVLGLGRSDSIQNDPVAILSMVLFCLAGLALSGIALLLALACSSYFPRARGYARMGHCGFKALWLLDPKRVSAAFAETVASRIKASGSVGILDVTGYDLLGKGPGPTGGLLYDALSTMTGIPVKVLLLDPSARTHDPEQKVATVFQTILGEMEVTAATYQRKIRSTLDAVEALNEKRSPDAKITVRYYAEKPTFRALIFEGSVLVAAWAPREGQAELPFLEISRRATGPCFQEGFRRHFARLWSSSVEADKLPEPAKPPSAAVRKSQLAETTA